MRAMTQGEVRYFVSRGTTVTGPHGEQELLAAIRSGQLGAGVAVRPESSEQWQAIEQHPLFSLALQQVAQQRVVTQQIAQSSHNKIGLLVAVVGFLGFGVWTLWPAIVSSTKADVMTAEEAAKMRGASPAAQPTSAPPASREEQARRVVQDILKQTTLSEAIGKAKPLMADTNNDADAGALAVGMWALKRGGFVWWELMSVQETTFGKAKKDPMSARGQRLCFSGSLVEIHTKKTTDGDYFEGGIINDALDVVSFVAIGSSGSLVERSAARLCGIVTGTNSYDNVSGGQTQTVRVVGAFDLPDNKADAAAPSPHAMVGLVCCDALEKQGIAADDPHGPAINSARHCRKKMRGVKTEAQRAEAMQAVRSLLSSLRVDAPPACR